MFVFCAFGNTLSLVMLVLIVLCHRCFIAFCWCCWRFYYMHVCCCRCAALVVGDVGIKLWLSLSSAVLSQVSSCQQIRSINQHLSQ